MRLDLLCAWAMATRRPPLLECRLQPACILRFIPASPFPNSKRPSTPPCGSAWDALQLPAPRPHSPSKPAPCTSKPESMPGASIRWWMTSTPRRFSPRPRRGGAKNHDHPGCQFVGLITSCAFPAFAGTIRSLARPAAPEISCSVLSLPQCPQWSISPDPPPKSRPNPIPKFSIVISGSFAPTRHFFPSNPENFPAFPLKILPPPPKLPRVSPLPALTALPHASHSQSTAKF